MDRSVGEEITLEIPGLSIAARAWGPPDGLRVLALHGWLDSAASFDLLAPLLTGLRIIAVDLPGHGLSGWRPPGLAYHLVDHIQDVVWVLDALGWQTASVLGHSMGGGIGCLLAGAFPERIERLALLEALAPLTAEPEEAPRRLAEGIRKMSGPLPSRSRTYPTREAMMARLIQACPGMTDDAARTLVLRGTRETPGGYRWCADPRLRVPSLLRLSRAQVYAFLDRIACPTLIVRASQGFPFDQDEARSQLRHIKDARVIEVTGGHHLHLDSPAQISEAIELFFASTRRPSQAPAAR